MGEGDPSVVAQRFYVSCASNLNGVSGESKPMLFLISSSFSKISVSIYV